MNNKRTILTCAPIVVALLLMTTPLLSQSVSAKKNGSFDGPIVPTFHYNDGTVETKCISKCDQLSESTTNSASAARSDSASSAKSDNNVKCFAFCLGVSSANSGSAADSNSRTNSPGNTASALPVSPQSTIQTPTRQHHDLVGEILGKDAPPSHVIYPMPNPVLSAGTPCLDNNGGVEDEGYSFGYTDAQNGQSIASIKDHGNHTDLWRTGYRNGWQAGAEDLTHGVSRNPC
jgi:hypothetical protein